MDAESPVSSDIKAPVGSSQSGRQGAVYRRRDRPHPRAASYAATSTDRSARSQYQARWAANTRTIKGPVPGQGEDLKDLIELTLHTGFRIEHVDALLYEPPARQQGDDSRADEQRHVFAWVPIVRDRIRKRAKTAWARALYYDWAFRSSGNRHERLAPAAGSRCSMRPATSTQPPTPHRFRHTFARILLEKAATSHSLDTHG